MWITLMDTLSQVQNSGQHRGEPNKTVSLDGLISSLRETQRALCECIEAEEERTKVCDLGDPHYSLLARSMRHRADNLATTIATLESSRAA